MIDTRLVFIEGLPGSGKTTTAQNLAAEIANSGTASQCFYEWSTDHPIPIGEHMDLRQVIASSLAREDQMLRDWAQFARRMQAENCVTVMESRFWQTSSMMMYMAGHPVEGVYASNQRVIEAVQGLRPVLIYFAIDDPAAFAERTVRIKNEEWQRSGVEGSWSQHIFGALSAQKWFTERGLSGLAGMAALMQAWSGISETLYERTPFPKLKIRNPHTDWQESMHQMRAFLGLA